MLFDLQGRRKTAVKGVYLALAVLLGGGLVLFGVGSNVQGGLADLFTGQSGGSGEYRKAVEQSAEKVAADPKNVAALEDLIANRYIYAGAEYDEKTQEFKKAGRQQLGLLIDDWEKYIALKERPDAGTANYAVNAYVAIEDAKGAQKAQTLVAAAEPNAGNYIALMQFALSAGDQRVADASALKAKELATPDQMTEVLDNIKELRKLGKERSAEVQRQIQEQFAAQQQQGGGGQAGNPFAGGGAGGAPPGQ
ncbi:MAG: hypothetical protein WAO61_00540 [Solirubrobacterales bacterium]